MKHGSARRGKKTRLYTAWVAMRQRCNDPNYEKFEHYGGRGIAVCARWDSFEAFADDVGAHPGPGWTLDRRDTDGDYEPSNCRWVTRTEQSRNRRSNKFNYETAAEARALFAGGVSMREIARRYNTWPNTVKGIVRGVAWQ